MDVRPRRGDDEPPRGRQQRPPLLVAAPLRRDRCGAGRPGTRRPRGARATPCRRAGPTRRARPGRRTGAQDAGARSRSAGVGDASRADSPRGGRRPRRPGRGGVDRAPVHGLRRTRAGRRARTRRRAPGRRGRRPPRRVPGGARGRTPSGSASSPGGRRRRTISSVAQFVLAHEQPRCGCGCDGGRRRGPPERVGARSRRRGSRPPRSRRPRAVHQQAGGTGAHHEVVVHGRGDVGPAEQGSEARAREGSPRRRVPVTGAEGL